MGKILVFIFEEMTDYEITFITHLLGADANKEVITISYEDRIIKGRSGFLYKASKLVSEVLVESVDGIIKLEFNYYNSNKGSMKINDSISNTYCLSSKRL